MSLHYNPIFRKVFVSVLPLIISWSLFFLFCCNSVSFISFRIVFSGKTGITGLYLGYMGFHIENYQKRQILGNKGIKKPYLTCLHFISPLHSRWNPDFLGFLFCLLTYLIVFCYKNFPALFLVLSKFWIKRQGKFFLAYYGLLLNFCQIYCKGLLNIFL